MDDPPRLSLVLQRQDGSVGHGRLSGIGVWHDHAVDALSTYVSGHGQHTVYGPEGAVQG